MTYAHLAIMQLHRAILEAKTEADAEHFYQGAIGCLALLIASKEI